MKTIKNLSMLMALMLIFSCSPEQEEVIVTDEANYQQQTNGSGAENGSITIDLERALAWSAYISGIILQDAANTAERTAVEGELVNGNRAISFDDLLGPNPISTGFKTKFQDILEGYLGGDPYNDVCPGLNDDEPDEPIVDGGNLTPNGYMNIFIDYLLNDNCLELYFPDGVDFTQNEVTTGAHPLTSYYWNEGIKRFDLYGSGIKSNCENETDPVAITPNYVYVGNPNVMIGRPVRVPGIINCVYNVPGYPADFETFLEGPF